MHPTPTCHYRDHVGKFITPRRRADRELSALLLAEAHRLYQSRTPYPMAIDRMIELAGSNPDAFRYIDGNFRELSSSAEGQAVIRLMGAADLTKRDRSGEIRAHISRRSGMNEERLLRIMNEVDSAPDPSPSWWPSED